MIRTQHPTSLLSTFVGESNANCGIAPLSKIRDFTWDNAKRDSSKGEHNHTPPIGHRARQGDGFKHCHQGLHTSLSSNSQRMCNEDGIQTFVPSIGGHQYVVGRTATSNGPYYQRQQPTIDNPRTMGMQKPFYDSYPSANRSRSPQLPKKDNIAQNEETARRRASNDADPIASHLQIPPSINDSKGSLPEFAAQVRTYKPFKCNSALINPR